MPTGAVCPFVNGPAPYGDRVEREDRMIRTTLRTALFGLVIAAITLLSACQAATPAKTTTAEPAEPATPQQPLSWADILDQYRVEEAVYAIGIYLPDGGAYVIGSGFAAYYTNALWTNAHVAIALRDTLNAVLHLQPIPFAVQSGTAIGGDGTYVLIGFDVHPHYDGTASSPDVAVIDIHIEGDLPVLLDLLPAQHAPELQVGQPIATMGFPGEVNHPYTVAPIATFKEGTISALRPFSLSAVPTAANTTFVQHNLDLSGGTSGSPIIDREGWVVAINNAGTETLVFDERTGQPQRVPTGNIGFGIRSDEAWRLIDYFDSSVGSTRRVATATREVLGTYEAFPENWDGTTVAP